MPGWHEATKKLVEAGKLQVVGIIQEQHPERCKLFMQWKRMDFPVLVDSFNLLEVSVVPITLGIDEHGVVRRLPREPGKLAEEFLDREFEAPGNAPESSPEPQVAPRSTDIKINPPVRESLRQEKVQQLARMANELLFAESPPRVNEALEALEAHVIRMSLERDRSNGEYSGRSHFGCGVAYRMRYDSPERKAGDFAKAVEHWQQALDLNPNQYIWRRRIQQYGPKLDKPYPFYDWVERAQREIHARGEKPVKLTVALTGSELAARGEFVAAAGESKEPDPDGRITRDEPGLIQIETVVVPSRIKPGQTARVHVTMRPDGGNRGHWNNEAEGVAFWLDAPTGWQVDRRSHTLANPVDKAVSDEPRRFEFEIRAPDDASGEIVVPGYALYYVCEGADGACLYRRQDIAIRLLVK